MVDAIKLSTSLVKKVYAREHHINERVCSTGQIFDRTYRFESCPDYKSVIKCLRIQSLIIKQYLKSYCN
jgi:hypothetical protein